MSCFETFKIQCLVSYRFATDAVRIAIQTIVLPLMIIHILPNNKQDVMLAMVSGISMFIGFPVFLITSWLGDKLSHRFGRRLPYLFCGTGICLIGLYQGISIHTPAELLLASIFLFAGIAMSESAHIALLPELVHRDKLNTTLSWLARWVFLARLISPYIAGYLVLHQAQFLLDKWFHRFVPIRHTDYYYVLIVCILILVLALMNIMIFIREKPVCESLKEKQQKTSLKKILLYPDGMTKRFYYFLLSRTLGYIPIITLPSYLLFYLVYQFHLHTKTAAHWTGVFFVAMTLSAFVATAFYEFFHKRASHLHATKNTIMLALILSLGSVLMLWWLSWSLTFVLFATVIQGLAFGLYYPATLSYGINHIPHVAWRGLFTSLITATTFFAFLFGVVITGCLVHLLQSVFETQKYIVMFAYFTFCTIISIYCMQLAGE